MTKPLITLPCTAQEMANALHAACDHDGLWDADVDVQVFDIENHVYGLALCGEAEMPSKKKGETK